MSQIEKLEPVRKIRQLRCAPNPARRVTNRFRGQRIAINRNLEFPAEHLQPADVIAMLVCQEHAVECR